MIMPIKTANGRMFAEVTVFAVDDANSAAGNGALAATRRAL
jgi:hypothetical protein